MQRSLKLSLSDGVFHAVMVGVSESYFGALAVELGHRDTALALLVTVPLLAGALGQPFAGILASLLGSQKRLVVAGAILQALTHLSFFAITALEIRALEPLLLTKCLFWVSGLVTAPAWSAWMATLTRDVDRERFFAERSALTHFVLVSAFTGAGLYLARASAGGAALPALAQLHLVGLAARALSALSLSLKLRETASTKTPRVGTRRRLVTAAQRSRWQIAAVVAALMFGTQIAAPFFTPYMLRVLELDYVAFAALLAVAILAKAVVFAFCHRAASRFGLKVVLAVGGAGVAVAPTLWFVFDSLPGLVFIQALSGASWAGVEFASFQLLLASAPQRLRLEFLSLAYGLSGLLQLAGSLTGSWLLTELHLDYLQVFAISGCVRALPILLLARAITQSMTVRPLPQLFMRIVSVRPGEGVVRRPIVEVLPEPRAAPPAEERQLPHAETLAGGKDAAFLPELRARTAPPPTGRGELTRSD